MDHKSTAWIVLAAIVAAAVCYGIYWQVRSMRDKEILQERVRCQQIAERYKASNPFDIIFEVEYSPERHTCLAEVETINQGEVTYLVDDLISGWGEVVGSCKINKCDNAELIEKQNKEFTILLHSSLR